MYLWFKWLHIIAVISWMAGVLYLYRLFINHRERGVTSRDNHELLKIMEYRLYRYITVPAMIVAAIAGFGMVMLQPDMLSAGWMHVKLLMVFFLIVATLYGGHLRLIAAENPENLPSAKILRFANEVPTLLMMVIVGMVVFKAI
jgi:putative membrane protein